MSAFPSSGLGNSFSYGPSYSTPYYASPTEPGIYASPAGSGIVQQPEAAVGEQESPINTIAEYSHYVPRYLAGLLEQAREPFAEALKDGGKLTSEQFIDAALSNKALQTGIKYAERASDAFSAVSIATSNNPIRAGLKEGLNQVLTPAIEIGFPELGGPIGARIGADLISSTVDKAVFDDVPQLIQNGGQIASGVNELAGATGAGWDGTLQGNLAANAHIADVMRGVAANGPWYHQALGNALANTYQNVADAAGIGDAAVHGVINGVSDLSNEVSDTFNTLWNAPTDAATDPDSDEPNLGSAVEGIYSAPEFDGSETFPTDNTIPDFNIDPGYDADPAFAIAPPAWDATTNYASV